MGAKLFYTVFVAVPPRRSLCSFAAALLLFMLLCGLGSCSSTKNLQADQTLLRRATVDLKTDGTFNKKAELANALSGAIVQQPNDYSLGFFPFKLWFYNARYARFQRDTANYQLRAGIAQPPVIYDSTARRRAAQNMRGILYGYGLFYGSVSDTVVVRGKKASVTYRVQTGMSYLIDSLVVDVRNERVREIVRASLPGTILEKGKPFAMTSLDLERRRISDVVRNAGYYKFSPENITFRIDTHDKRLLRNAANPFGAAINFIRLQQKKYEPTVDVRIIARWEGDSNTLHRFHIGSVTVYPDYGGTRDLTSTTLMEHTVGKVAFRYHNYWLKENIIYRNIFLEPGAWFSQEAYDRTVTRLGELGVFQSVRVLLIDDDDTAATRDNHPLRCILLLTPAARYDANTNLEVSSGSTYTLGSAVSVGLRNRNLGRGANALNLTLSGGVESLYAREEDESFLDGFFIRSRNLGANAAIEFPKFIAPVRNASLSRRNFPRTVLSVGAALLAREDYFTLANYTANFAYNWRESRTKTWELTPAFVSVQQLLRTTDSFDRLSNEISFIRNSYKSTFIEGQSIAFTFSNSDARRRFGYSYLRVSLEEAGALMSTLRAGVRLANQDFDFGYEQYGKIDFDARHYFTRRRSTTAVRLSGGIGLPYGGSRHLPYVKQYFVGGANSIRGWRVRTLGPGSVVPDTGSKSDFIDRTGDIKLEANVEYRFDIVQFFAGAVRVAGATFVDAGNIWLANAEPADFPGGEFKLSKLGQDIALSSGLGIRLDFGGFITLRLDVGVPLKIPYDLDYDGAVDGWVLDEVRIGSSEWRGKNLIPQIGIGYPF